MKSPKRSIPQIPVIAGKETIQFPSYTTTTTDSGNLRENAGNGTYGNATSTSAKETELPDYHSVITDLENPRCGFDSNTPRTPYPIQESPNYSGQLSPKEVRISFNDEVRQPSNPSSSNGKRTSSLMRMKTKSRLMDQPEIDQRTPTSEKIHGDFEEDEFSTDDDLPNEFKKLRYNKWTLLQVISLILIISALSCTLAIPNFRNKSLYDLQWWKWEVMVLVVICGRLVSGWGIRILVFFIKRNFLLRKRVLYFVYGLKKAVQNCIWLALVLMAWQIIFNKKVERMAYGKKVLPYVTKIWVCLLVGTLVWLMKTLLIKVLATNFHVSKYFDRIQDSLFNQYVIETLSGPPVIEIQQEQQEEEEEEEEEEEWVMKEVEKLESAGASLPPQPKANMFQGWRGIGTPRSNTATATATTGKSDVTSLEENDNDNGITIDHLHRLNQKNISAWNMDRMMNVINTRILASLDKNYQITTENQAKVAAKNMFCNVAALCSKHIYLEDLKRFLHEDEALKTLRLIDDASETKGISKAALKSWVVNVFRERRALALSLSDTKTAVDKLHQMLNVVVGIIIIVFWLLILKVATTQFFIFLSSQLVLVAFVFGNTCKTMFESIIFLFIMHPFDVGDRCEIDGVQMVVEEMNILTTIFLRYDNQKIAYPNIVLSTLPIANYHRSPDMGDAIDFSIHVSTPVEKIAKMKKMITRYVEEKSDHWQPEPMIVVRDVEDLNRLNISTWLTHRMNFQDMGERWKRRGLLVEEMIKIFKDLDIQYRMLPLEINARNIPWNSNRLPSNWITCAN